MTNTALLTPDDPRGSAATPKLAVMQLDSEKYALVLSGCTSEQISSIDADFLNRIQRATSATGLIVFPFEVELA